LTDRKRMRPASFCLVRFASKASATSTTSATTNQSTFATAQSEARLAQALEKAGVLFLPNGSARLGLARERCNKEADFLVCRHGRWGILEVDGEPFHPPSRMTEDPERDRLFKSHGVLVVEHFDAAECFENAEGVIQKFLFILART
jgi:hypothetical protein